MRASIFLLCFSLLSNAQQFTVLEKTGNEEQLEKAQFRVKTDKEATLVTIHAGMKPTGGWTVRILGVDRKKQSCVVRYRIDGPPPKAMVTQALTYPSATVRIHRVCAKVEVNPPLPQENLN